MSTQNPGDDQRPPDRPGGEPDWARPELNIPEPGQPGPDESWQQGAAAQPWQQGSGGQPGQPGVPPGPGQPGMPSGPGQPGVPPTPPGVPPSGPRPGSIQRQEPGVTQPRPPTVAEARARDKARRDASAAAAAAAAAADAKRRTRNRVLIGGVAIVGVAGLVGGGYLAYRALNAEQVTAYCVKYEDGQEVVVEDRYCEGSNGGSGGGGGSFVVLGGGPQYRYYYGGNNTVGKPPVGGTTVKPKGAEIKTRSGTTIQRGGLGSKSTGGGS